eukprot:GFKZ01002370.1.p1 GENE.GFKZ01002370.1~~GFKZ01002370.1.p1  ORF type:complete len:397 (+),score=32.53 GFKZ01002370.1:1238-2428(+)
MTSTEDIHSPQQTQLQPDDPAQLFIPGPVLSDDNDFGTLISATVAPEWVAEVGVSAVLIRILPIRPRDASALRSVVTKVSSAIPNDLTLRYIGIWEASPMETWLVSERREVVSLRNLFASTSSNDIESVVSYVAERCLDALNRIHENHAQAHLNLCPGNIYLSPEHCAVIFADVGIYDVLYSSLKSRRALPGVKLWQHPRKKDGSLSSYHLDVWDLGITILQLVDGGASLARMKNSGRRVPRLANPSRWSAQFNSFVSLLFSTVTDNSLTSDELLNHRFVIGAPSTACRAAMAEYLMLSKEGIVGPYNPDTISTLFRQNTAVVQAPLISIDDVSTDQFCYDNWNGVDQNRPTVEMSLLRILRTCKEQPEPRDTEGYKSLSRTIETIDSFLETADMQ